MFPRQEYGIFTVPVIKLKEMMVASRLEKAYSKDKIIEMYFNTVPFGENVYGIEAASERYFGKSAAQLECGEAAVLVGMLKANTYYNPHLNPGNALFRRNVVLNLMYNQGMLTEEEHQTYTNTPLKTTNQDEGKTASFAGYYRQQVISQAQKIIDAYNEEHNTNYNLYTSALKIVSSLDKGMQLKAEAAVKEWMPKLQKDFDNQWARNDLLEKDKTAWKLALNQSGYYQELKNAGLGQNEIEKELQKQTNIEGFSWPGQTPKNGTIKDQIKRQARYLQVGMVALDAQTGQILAYVGGIDHQFFKYDHVSSTPGRQVGSTFKPIVYATAIEKGVSPCKYFKAAQQTYLENGKEWTPANSGEEYEGEYTMEGALTNSVNTVSVQVMEASGVENVIHTAKGMGVTTELPEVSSLALGTASVPVIQMAQVYAAFANGGKAVKPNYIDEIVDKKGTVIYKNKKENHPQVIQQETAQLIAHMLQSVVNEGTGRSIRNVYHLPNELAGKTGTTQNNVDGWFIGFNPKIVVAIWVGNDIPALHFKTTALGQGAHTALPIFAHFFKMLNADASFRYYTQQTFPPLPPSLKHKVECDPFKEEFKFVEWFFGKGGGGHHYYVSGPKTKAKKPKKNKENFFKRLFGGNRRR